MSKQLKTATAPYGTQTSVPGKPVAFTSASGFAANVIYEDGTTTNVQFFKVGDTVPTSGVYVSSLLVGSVNYLLYTV